MTDSINAGDDSDRLFTYWPVQQQVAVEPTNTNVLAIKNDSGIPVLQEFESSEAFWVELPDDIESMRKENLELARQWRKQVRSVLQPALDDGWFISSMNVDRTAILVEPGTSDYEFSED
jgi:predicted GNAT superfamily acetyltransferase